jgi:hypothetical protein
VKRKLPEQLRGRRAKWVEKRLYLGVDSSPFESVKKQRESRSERVGRVVYTVDAEYRILKKEVFARNRLIRRNCCAVFYKRVNDAEV